MILFLCSCKQEPKEKTVTLKEYVSCNPIDVNKFLGKTYLDESFLKEIDNIKLDSSNLESNSGMIKIKGGVFSMGGDLPDGFENMPKTALPQGDELPKHPVQVSDFYIDEHEVTNAQFKKFVDATGYVTTAERPIDWEDL
ncbi:MAG: SUMF1/EgtB/PvdO family nonheme iron enzyme, partial [Psychroserpens sp.]|nr:SUMF1/EgtB/PvdO family nonheme iron enzyme [Psychroserpens sp.]